jgi:hypothetical protein
MIGSGSVLACKRCNVPLLKVTPSTTREEILAVVCPLHGEGAVAAGCVKTLSGWVRMRELD